MDWFRRLNKEEGVTIIQVTHSDHWASYGERTIELVDGRIETDATRTPEPAESSTN